MIAPGKPQHGFSILIPDNQEDFDFSEEPQKEESRGPLSGYFAITDGYRDPGHPGIDMGARDANGKRNYDADNPPAIYFLTDGTIRSTGKDKEYDPKTQTGGAGNFVTYFPKGYDKKYIVKAFHLVDRPRYQEGDKINKGDNLGDMGNTGNSSGPHLHLAIRKRNQYGVYDAIDPRDAPFWDDQWLEKELPYQ